jgi:hypothetical protein
MLDGAVALNYLRPDAASFPPQPGPIPLNSIAPMSESTIRSNQQGTETRGSAAEPARRKPFLAPKIEELGGLTQLTELGGSL